MMKALISAFALLSFVAATTVPYVAQAQNQAPTHQTMIKHSLAKKASTKKSSKKHVAKAKKTHKSMAKKTASKKKMESTPAKG
jgi:hypothetical protein